jgi:hypothetical protein
MVVQTLDLSHPLPARLLVVAVDFPQGFQHILAFRRKVGRYLYIVPTAMRETVTQVSMAAKNQAILAGWKSAMVWVTLRTAASLKNGPGGRQAIYFESFFAASASAAC